MGKEKLSCNSTVDYFLAISSSDSPLELTSKSVRSMLNRTLYYRLPFMVPLVQSTVKGMSRRTKGAPVRSPPVTFPPQNIEPGDVVTVRSEDEIRKTLNEENRAKGLGFMPEMVMFCGQQFRVAKRVKKIIIECTGEPRDIKSPTFILEGANCSGEFHEKCDRYCPFLWKEDWLIKMKE
jgi:hypothetical protein